MAKAKKPEYFFIERKNVLIFLIGLALIAIGFIVMAQPPVNGFLSRTLAPIILVVAYLIIIPIAIFKRTKHNQSESGS